MLEQLPQLVRGSGRTPEPDRRSHEARGERPIGVRQREPDRGPQVVSFRRMAGKPLLVVRIVPIVVPFLEEPDEVPRMGHGVHLVFPAGAQLLQGIEALRLEHAQARRTGQAFAHDQRSLDQLRQVAGNVGGIVRRVADCRDRRLQRPSPGKHREPPEQRGLIAVQQRMAPVDHGFERPVLRQHVARPARQQSEVIGKRGSRGRQSDGGHVHRRQFDRQRIAVELPAERGGILQGVAVDVQLRRAFADTGEQQLHRG